MNGGNMFQQAMSQQKQNGEMLTTTAILVPVMKKFLKCKKVGTEKSKKTRWDEYDNRKLQC